MDLSDFDYTLPETLIARYPMPERTASRLLHLGLNGSMNHTHFHQVIDLLIPGDLLVFNDTRVIRARLFGAKATGGRVELLIERPLDEHRALAHVHSNRSMKVGSIFYLEDKTAVQILGRRQSLFELSFLSDKKLFDILDELGHIPLPPYLKRSDEFADHERYQTVYAKHKGSVAAPTAGLHFDEPLLQAIRKKGVDVAFITLHVGAGTFQPVRVEKIEDHHMHAELIDVPQSVCDKINATHQNGGRVIAVGTTTVRSLESAARHGEVAPYKGETDIFIYPGFKFNCVDAMITNFHLPKSSLLMLVSAFVGRDEMMAAYEEAIKEKYRFYSYGDAMFIG